MGSKTTLRRLVGGPEHSSFDAIMLAPYKQNSHEVGRKFLPIRSMCAKTNLLISS